MRCTFVPVPGIAQPGSIAGGGFMILHGPGFMFVGACAMVIEKREVKPVSTVGFVVVVAVSSGVRVVTSICGWPTPPTGWRQTRFVGGELLAGDFQSPWKTLCASLLKPGAFMPPTS